MDDAVMRQQLTDAPRVHSGSALVVVLALLAAGVALAGAVARSAAMELAMTEQALSSVRARTAAEAGLAAALRARGWSAGPGWSGAGQLPEGAQWSAEVGLLAARVDLATGLTDWVFEARSVGRAGLAGVALSRGFSVRGVLPGEPVPLWWRQVEPLP
jgi:hypothetical protein